VRAEGENAAKKAEAVLAQSGANHIHRTAPLPPTVWPID